MTGSASDNVCRQVVSDDGQGEVESNVGPGSARLLDLDEWLFALAATSRDIRH
jgi:hypothetical protein